jgi:ketosteroid isomerase-like protein
MAHANVEIIRRFLDLALRCRDLEAAMQLAHPDAEMDWSNSRAPYRGVYRGFDEAIGAWRTWLEAWEEWSTEVTEAIDIDPETLVIVTQVHARGRGSGITVEAEGAGVWQVRDGKIAYAKLYQSKAEALAAVSSRRST